MSVRGRVPLRIPGTTSFGDLESETVALVRAASRQPDPVRLSPKLLKRNLVIADATAALVGLAVGLAIWIATRSNANPVRTGHVALTAAALPVLLITFSASKLYSARAVERIAEEMRRLWLACAMAPAAMVALAFLVQYRALSRSWALLILVCVGAALTIERLIARRIFNRLRASGAISRPIAIIGTDTHAVDLMHTLQAQPAHGYRVTGLVGDDVDGGRSDFTRLGTIDDAAHVLSRHGCVGAIISLPSIPSADVNRLTRDLTDRGFHVALSSSLRDIDVTRIRPQSVDGQTMMYVEPTIRHGWRAVAKRVFDLSVAVVALVVTFPILLISAILIKAESSGPVLFRQIRVGRDGRPFEIFKLRTMSDDAEARKADLMGLNESDGPLFKVKADPRITRVGKSLRKWSIDELPQFLNVIRGEMSVVGPRPALPDEVAQWDDEVAERLRVLPGITGLWQVTGRADTSFDVYKRLDLCYVDNWSLWHDARIVLKTFGAVALRRGAS